MVLKSQTKLLYVCWTLIVKVLCEVNFPEENTKLSLVQSAEEAGKLCLKDFDKCIHEDSNYQSIADHLLPFFLGTTPPFDAGAVEGVSPLCKNHSTRYVEDLKKFKLWALKMHDSSAKLPSGILNGHVDQFGVFDSCVQSGEELHEIQGQYCLASIQVEYLGPSPYISALLRLAHSHYSIKVQIDDFYLMSRVSPIKWALCVPSGCSASDVELGLKAMVDPITKNTDFQVKVKVDPSMCSSAHTSQIPASSVIILSVLTGFVVLAVLATRYDYNAVGTKNQWILAFSLRKNTNSLMSLAKLQDDIRAMHGVRFLNTLMILMAHKGCIMQFLPYVNKTEMTKNLHHLSTPGRAASRLTDSCLLFSATLTTYLFMKKLNQNRKINIVEEYVSRLFRIWPVLAVLTAFSALDFSWLQSGPMWKPIMTQHSDICKKYWWRNLLFIQNYYGFEQMCLPHTHHLATDMQLFAVSPLFVWLLWKWPKKGAFILGFLAFASTFMRYYVTYTMKLSDYVHIGMSFKQILATIDNTYFIPAYRATAYIMGIILGYILINFRNTALTKNQIRFGNCLAFLSFFNFLYVTSAMNNVDYIYNPTHAAWFAALSPILWCFPFAWIIFTAHTGHTGSLQRFFSWPAFAFGTKISYAFYLVHVPVFVYSIVTTDTSQRYNVLQFIFMSELVPMFFFILVLTLLVEMPFQNIRNIVLRKTALHGKSN